jgi:hypothetical protein
LHYLLKCDVTGEKGVSSSVVDRHRFDADSDPDPNFHFDADPDPDPEGIKTMPMHMRILPQVLHMLENREKKIIFIYSNGSLKRFLLSSNDQTQMFHDF